MEEEKKKGFSMPSAYVIVFIALALVILMTWFIAPSVFVDGEVIRNAVLDPDTGEVITNQGPQKLGFYDLIMAPVLGFQDGAAVIIAILISGGFVGLLNKTGALDAGVGVLLNKYKGKTLIAVMMFFIAILGTVYGLWEELAAFSIIIVPMFVKAGYDRMTGIAVMFVSATVGVMSSIINPFSVGTAVAAIGDDSLSMGSGILLRMVLFVVLFIIGLIRVTRYAEMVRRDPSKSITADIPETQEPLSTDAEVPEMTKRRMSSLVVFGLMVLFLFIGYMPWATIELGESAKNFFDAIPGTVYWENYSDTAYTFQAVIMAPIDNLVNIPLIGNLTGLSSMVGLGDWYFDEFNVLFLTGALLVGFINKMSEKEFISAFVGGASDLLGVCFVLSIARGISVVMGDKVQGMSVTMVDILSSSLGGVPLWAFSIAAIGLFMVIGLFLQSSSGVAGLTMPIMGVVASSIFIGAGLSGQAGEIILISAYTLGLNFTAGVYPDATPMGVLELYEVPYDRYFKFHLKTYIMFIIAGALILLTSTFIA